MPQGGHLIPPVNFGMVEDDLYRCGQPNPLNFPFLEKLQLRTIIYLAPDDPSYQFLSFIDDQEIDFHHVGICDGEGLSPWNQLSEEVVITAVQLILNPKNYPMAIMCNLGRHRTGTVIGCLRKLQRWNLTSIFEEYRRYAGSKVRLMNEQFIELFDIDLISIPEHHAPWLVRM